MDTEENLLRKSILLITSLIISLGIVLASCSGTANDDPTQEPLGTTTPAPVQKEKVTAKIAGLKGPTSMGMVRLFAEIESLSEYVDVEFDIVNTPDVITAGLLSGEISIAAVPTNLAAVLYNKTGGAITMLGVNTLGVLHIVADKSLGIDDISDLKGKTIAATGKGTVPEYVLNYILEKNGLEPGVDVTIDYRGDHSELATLVELGEVDLAMLPQPFVTIVTSRNKNVELAIDLTDEWIEVSPEGTELPMGCLVGSREFADTYTSEVVQLLVSYNQSVNWVNQNPADAAELIVDFGILPSAELAEAAIPESNIRYIFSQNSMEMMDAFLKILFEYNPKSIGGALPGDDFYFSPE